MPVQKKSRTADPGQQKKKNWLQIGVVAFIVLVVVMCVLSFSNFSNFFSGDTTATTGGTVNEGDPAAIYFQTNIGNTTTFYYAAESTSDLQPYRVVADSNSSIVDDDYSSIFVSVGNSTIPYGIYALEINSIAKEIVGHQYGDVVTVDLPYIVQVSCTADDVKALGYDIANLSVGDLMPMYLGYTDILGEKQIYMRNGVVTDIKSDLSGLTLNCGCDTIDVAIVGKYSA